MSHQAHTVAVRASGAESVVILPGDPDTMLAANLPGGDSSRIGAKCQPDQFIHRLQKLSRLLRSRLQFQVISLHFRQRSLYPLRSLLHPLLRFTHCLQIILQTLLISL